MPGKKDHIINTAVELFAENGFEGTSIRDIASKAGVNIAMINYYFGSKENLFISLIEYNTSYTKEVLNEIAKDSSLTEIEKVYKVIENYVTRLFTNRNFHRAITQEMMLNQREDLQKIIVNILSPNSLVIKKIIHAGIKRGVFKKVDESLTIVTLIGSINQVLLSKKMCNKLIGKKENYIPYEDKKFKTRMTAHLKQLMHSHLLVNQNN